MRDSLSGHKTGLPKKLLELFNPLPPVETVPPVHRRKPKLPYSGVGQYVDLFAAPGVRPLQDQAGVKSPHSFRAAMRCRCRYLLCTHLQQVPCAATQRFRNLQCCV
jgi:hypothetical protein